MYITLGRTAEEIGKRNDAYQSTLFLLVFKRCCYNLKVDLKHVVNFEGQNNDIGGNGEFVLFTPINAPQKKFQKKTDNCHYEIIEFFLKLRHV